MTKCLLVVFFACILADVYSQHNVDSLLNKENLLPPNCRYIGHGLYMDETEIANIHWLEFVHYLAKDSTREHYVRMCPDTTVWRDAELLTPVGPLGTLDSTGTIQSFEQHYFRYPGYRYFPVVGITLEQANAYCTWRSEAVNMFVNDILVKKNKKFRIKYTYYVPSLEEYRQAADSALVSEALPKNTLKLISRYIQIQDKKHRYFLGSTHQDFPALYKDKRLLFSGFNFLSYIYSNPANSKGFYNTYGNVSEISSEKGKSFGGSWKHDGSLMNRDAIFYYDGPQNWLGLRCACKVEVIWKEN